MRFVRILFLIFVFSACGPVVNPTPAPVVETTPEVTLETVQPVKLSDVLDEEEINALSETDGMFELAIFVESGDIPYLYLWVPDENGMRIGASISGSTSGGISHGIYLDLRYKVTTDREGNDIVFEGTGMDMLISEFAGFCDTHTNNVVIACQSYSHQFAD